MDIWQLFEFSLSPLIQLMSQDSLPDDPDDYGDPNNSGTTLGPLWDHSETTLGPLWDHSGITLGSLLDHSRITLESLLDNSRITLG